jgi:hypothetical protein
LKNDKKNKVLEAYQYTLEWAEIQAEEYVFTRKIAILLQQKMEAAESEYLHCINPLHVVCNSF